MSLRVSLIAAAGAEPRFDAALLGPAAASGAWEPPPERGGDEVGLPLGLCLRGGRLLLVAMWSFRRTWRAMPT